MDDSQESPTENECDASATASKSLLGGIGLAFSVLGFLFAAVYPWAEAAINQEPEAIEQVEDAIVDSAVRLKEKLAARLKGEEPNLPAPVPESVNWLAMAPIALGAVGLCFGVGGFVRHEEARLSGAALLLGATAIALQYALLIAAALVVLILIGILVSALLGS